MIFTYLTFLAAFAVAAVSEWFSIVGIMAIYAGAPLNAALIMGAVLGGSKLITASWLYRNWKYATWKLKAPLVYFLIALMVASSIGVFGFLSKAHLEQGAATINNTAKVERLDQQIQRENLIIADNEKVIAQLDATINSFIGKDRADRALSVRRSQAPQRKQLRADIDESQKKIDIYSNERLELTSEVRALQLEVGPIKYIADIFSSSGTETERIELAVKLFTLLIVSTLDPLAVILLIAANHTLLRLQNEKKIQADDEKIQAAPAAPDAPAEDIIPGAEDDSCTPEIETEKKSSQEKIIPINDRLVSDTICDTTLDEALLEKDTIHWPSIDYEEKETHISPSSIVQSTHNVEAQPADQKTVNTETKPVASAVVETLPEKIQDREVLVHALNRADTVAKTPWAQQDSVLTELLGNHTHFIPQKLKEKEINTAPVTDTTDVVQIEPTLSNDINKYPIRLSWLKEFKGN